MTLKKTREAAGMIEEQATLDYITSLLALPQAREKPPASPSEFTPAIEPTGPDIDESLPADCPSWAQGEFTVIPFRLAGIAFALPGHLVSAIVPWPDPVTPDPNQPRWAWGTVEWQGNTVYVIDSLRLLLPDHCRSERGYRQLLLVQSAGLACQQVEDQRVISPEQVRWRQDRVSRPWLLGMISQMRCALIDFEALIVS